MVLNADTSLGTFTQSRATDVLAITGVLIAVPTLWLVPLGTIADHYLSRWGFTMVTVVHVIGAVVATLAIAWPSSIMIFFLQRYIRGMKNPRKQKAIQFAAGALAVGLVLASAWQIALQINQGYAAYFLTIMTIVIALFTRWHPLYLIALGAALGIFGVI